MDASFVSRSARRRGPRSHLIVSIAVIVLALGACSTAGATPTIPPDATGSIQPAGDRDTNRRRRPSAAFPITLTDDEGTRGRDPGRADEDRVADAGRRPRRCSRSVSATGSSARSRTSASTRPRRPPSRTSRSSARSTSRRSSASSRTSSSPAATASTRPTRSPSCATSACRSSSSTPRTSRPSVATSS